MPRMANARQNLTEPPTPPTDIRGAHLHETGRFIMEEFSDCGDAWLVIDDEHVYPWEMLE